MIDSYISYLRDVRRYSQRTQELYRAALEDYAAWVAEDDPSDAVPDLIRNLIPSRLRQYEGHLIEKGLKPRTVHLHVSALSGFCGFLMKEGKLQGNPAKAIRRPKMEKRLPEYYTEKSLDEYLLESAHAAGEEELEIILQSPDPQKDKVDSKPEWDLVSRLLCI